MRLLLDTHVYLWCLNDDRKLSKTARDLITTATEVYVSCVSIWEMSIKVKLGKLEVNIEDAVNLITKSGFLELPLTVAHAMQVSQLPSIHQDPFDRALIAQAMNEPLRLLTSDSKLQEYSDLVKLV